MPSAHIFTSKWQLPLLNQWRGEMTIEKIPWSIFLEVCARPGIEPCTSDSSVRGPTDRTQSRPIFGRIILKRKFCCNCLAYLQSITKGPTLNRKNLLLQEQILSVKSRPHSRSKFFLLRVDPILGGLHHLRSKQEVTKVVSLCKHGWKTWQCTHKACFCIPRTEKPFICLLLTAAITQYV